MMNALLDAGDLITRARLKPLGQELAFDLTKGALSTDDDQRRTRGTRREDVASAFRRISSNPAAASALCAAARLAEAKRRREAGPHVVLRVLRFLR
jgi:hypothetical protein